MPNNPNRTAPAIGTCFMTCSPLLSTICPPTFRAMATSDCCLGRPAAWNSLPFPCSAIPSGALPHCRRLSHLRPPSAGGPSPVPTDWAERSEQLRVAANLPRTSMEARMAKAARCMRLRKGRKPPRKSICHGEHPQCSPPPGRIAHTIDFARPTARRGIR